ncbi:hypothetical protein GUITHDRAFT_150171 [Guillardia theta CCMP2712]|uniref:Secreted protein n=1 Tax=Guillardia theta (strain CCMP2712) TaxID=905079 RepID=L1K1B6_GUITC|nr:hypothetical protein GUITHDRAFT_150171 [Guillardia theta CCMP2712]EKX54173.1 hypothetical protein GUITHDRAFT_150171 [Guillardia theta CCMP2712]|eukprot:XP_005841153.1 hypothetical protein GUITHDRAFT_150171 [Guillardia theta CCMP2712]
MAPLLGLSLILLCSALRCRCGGISHRSASSTNQSREPRSSRPSSTTSFSSFQSRGCRRICGEVGPAC